MNYLKIYKLHFEGTCVFKGLSFPVLSRCRDIPIKDFPFEKKYILPLPPHSDISSGMVFQEAQPMNADTGYNLIYHAPVSGVVADIFCHNNMKYMNFHRSKNALGCAYERREPLIKTSETLINEIRTSGITGISEENSLTYQKLQHAKNKVHTVVVNAVETVPFLAAEYCLMMEKTKEILLGAEYIRYITSAEKVIIVIPKNKFLRAHLEEISSRATRFTIEELSVGYPVAYERFLIAQLTGIELPFGRDSIESKMIVHRPSTLLAVSEALLFGKPLIDRVITVDGAFAAMFGNFRVKLGTPISSFMRPYSVADSYIIINGSPLSGTHVNPHLGIDKNMQSVLIFEPLESPDEQDCIRCGLCSHYCPMRLQPFRLIDMVRNEEINTAKNNGLLECIDCNACSYVCPSFIPLGATIFNQKQSIIQESWNVSY